jgi:hypothetical protein
LQTSGDDVSGELLSEKEAAELLKKSCQTLRRWRRIGYGPNCTMVGRSPMYPLAWLNDWLKARAA